jgi:hypothetical protein
MVGYGRSFIDGEGLVIFGSEGDKCIQEAKEWISCSWMKEIGVYL